MSRRIRSLKPEIIEDEKTGRLSDTAFRLFISMITIADDHGNVRSDARWLQAQVWWAHAEPPNVLQSLIELTKAGLIVVYGVRGGTFAHLNGWSKHQRVDNAGKQHKVAAPNDPDALVISLTETESDESSPRTAASFREIPLDRIGEERRGPSGKPDPAADLADDLALVASTEINRHAGTRFRPDSDSIQKLCLVLAKANRTPDQVRSVIAFKRSWLDDPKMRQFFRPATLLANQNFTNYLDELEAAAPGSNGAPQRQSADRPEAVSPLMLAFEEETSAA